MFAIYSFNYAQSMKCKPCLESEGERFLVSDGAAKICSHSIEPPPLKWPHLGIFLFELWVTPLCPKGVNFFLIDRKSFRESKSDVIFRFFRHRGVQNFRIRFVILGVEKLIFLLKKCHFWPKMTHFCRPSMPIGGHNVSPWGLKLVVYGLNWCLTL